MNDAARKTQTTYLMLLVLHTLAASFIWGINTLFLLDAGLSNTEAFGANAFFTAGMVIFEVPTGVVADTRGRRTSYLLGTITLVLATLTYLLLWRVSAPFAAWAAASALLGLGFTFFSGAVEAWLVDALSVSGYTKDGGRLEEVFARGEIVEGIAMLGGSVAGGLVAQATNLGVPYLLRAVFLLLSFITAFVLMHDMGFTARTGKRPLQEVKNVMRDAIDNGLAERRVRWVMLTAPFTGAVMIYAFYAMQPYLLDLWGGERSYTIAGLAAAIVAGAQIAGGLLVPHLNRMFRRRTTVLLAGTIASAAMLAVIGLAPAFWIVITFLSLWALTLAAVTPVRQSYVNALIESKQRATVLSFDALLGSSGAAIIQPILGKAADVWSYPTSYLASAGVQMLAVPFCWLARRERTSADAMEPERDELIRHP
jgi:MFS family permease